MSAFESRFRFFTQAFRRQTLFVLGLMLVAVAVAAQGQVTYNASINYNLITNTSVDELNGIAVDPTGNVFIAVGNPMEIAEFPANGAVRVVLASGLPNSPSAIALDDAGNIYYTLGEVTSYGSGVLFKMPAGGGTPTAIPVTLANYNSTLSCGYFNPDGVAVDAAGDVFLSDSCGGYVIEVPWTGTNWGAQKVLLKSPNGPAGQIEPGGLALDAAGNLYIADKASSFVLELPLTGSNYGSPVVVAGLNGVSSVAIDAIGDLFATSYTGESNETVEFPAGGGAEIILSSNSENFSTAGPIAVDGKGDVYINTDSEQIVELQTTSWFPHNNVPTDDGYEGILSFNVAAGTVVRSIAVLTEGAGQISEKDLQDFTIYPPDTTCETGTAAEATTCGVAVDFYPPATGIRRGAVVFYGVTGQVLFSLPLYGIGTGPQIAYDGNTPASVAGTQGSLSSDGAVAMDGAGDLFVNNSSSGEVIEFPQTSSGYGAATTIASNLNSPSGLAVDGAGNLFVTLYSSSGSIVEIPKLLTGYGAPVTVASNLTFPYAITLDPSGNIFYVNAIGWKIMELVHTAGGYSSPQLVTSNVSAPYGIVVDSNGNVYATSLYDASDDPASGSVVEVPLTQSGYGAPVQLAGNLSFPWGILLEASGSLVFATDSDANQDDSTGTITELPKNNPGAGFGTPVVLATGLSYPQGITQDSVGNIDFTDFNSGEIMSLPRATPPPVDFSPSEVGQLSTQSQVVTVRNIGNSLLTFASIDYPTEFPESSSGVSDGDCFATEGLEGGASCPLTIGFDPSTGGARAGTLTLEDNNLDFPGTYQSIPLTGTGIGSDTVSLSASSLSFGSVTVGGQSNSQTVTLSNTGTGVLSITSIDVTGTNASSFDFANSCGTSLPVGASCTIHGHFAPVAAGALTATVTITDNAINSPQTIALNGTGVEPPVTLSAASLTYASTIEGEASTSQSVTLTNTGTAAVTITSVAVTGTNATSFVFASSCGSSLAVGANCTIHGHFAPVAVGALKAAITITDSASNSPQTIALSGTGVKGPVTLSAYSIAFGSTNINTWSASQTVIVTNSGTASVNISSIALTGTSASQFAVGNTCGTSLAVGATCQIHSHFQPTEAGAIVASITITDSAATSPQTITLTGIGVQPPVTLSASALTFPATTVGSSSASQTVTMTNTGTTTLSIASITVTGANAPSFVFANSCGTSLAVGANCTIHGHFAPTATGAATAVISITDSATGSPQSITLTGVGQ